MDATSPFVQLFYLYTRGDGAIGTHLDQQVAQASAGEPMIIVTGSDIFCFSGDGGPPVMHSFRLDTKRIL